MVGLQSMGTVIHEDVIADDRTVSDSDLRVSNQVRVRPDIDVVPDFDPADAVDSCLVLHSEESGVRANAASSANADRGSVAYRFGTPDI